MTIQDIYDLATRVFHSHGLASTTHLDSNAVRLVGVSTSTENVRVSKLPDVDLLSSTATQKRCIMFNPSSGRYIGDVPYVFPHETAELNRTMLCADFNSDMLFKVPPKYKPYPIARLGYFDKNVHGLKTNIHFLQYMADPYIIKNPTCDFTGNDIDCVMASECGQALNVTIKSTWYFWKSIWCYGVQASLNVVPTSRIETLRASLNVIALYNWECPDSLSQYCDSVFIMQRSNGYYLVPKDVTQFGWLDYGGTLAWFSNYPHHVRLPNCYPMYTQAVLETDLAPIYIGENITDTLLFGGKIMTYNTITFNMPFPSWQPYTQDPYIVPRHSDFPRNWNGLRIPLNKLMTVTPYVADMVPVPYCEATREVYINKNSYIQQLSTALSTLLLSMISMVIDTLSEVVNRAIQLALYSGMFRHVALYTAYYTYNRSVYLSMVFTSLTIVASQVFHQFSYG